MRARACRGRRPDEGAQALGVPGLVARERVIGLRSAVRPVGLIGLGQAQDDRGHRGRARGREEGPSIVTGRDQESERRRPGHREPLAGRLVESHGGGQAVEQEAREVGLGQIAEGDATMGERLVDPRAPAEAPPQIAQFSARPRGFLHRPPRGRGLEVDQRDDPRFAGEPGQEGRRRVLGPRGDDHGQRHRPRGLSLRSEPTRPRQPRLTPAAGGPGRGPLPRPSALRPVIEDAADGSGAGKERGFVRLQTGGLHLRGVPLLQQAQERLRQPHAARGHGRASEEGFAHPPERVSLPLRDLAEAPAVQEGQSAPHPRPGPRRRRDLGPLKLRRPPRVPGQERRPGAFRLPSPIRRSLGPDDEALPRPASRGRSSPCAAAGSRSGSAGARSSGAPSSAPRGSASKRRAPGS